MEEAVNTGNEQDFRSTFRMRRVLIYLAGSSGATLKYWNGSSWVTKPLKYWNGSSWQTKSLKYWDGASWA